MSLVTDIPLLPGYDVRDPRVRSCRHAAFLLSSFLAAWQARQALLCALGDAMTIPSQGALATVRVKPFRYAFSRSHLSRGRGYEEKV